MYIFSYGSLTTKFPNKNKAPVKFEAYLEINYDNMFPMISRSNIKNIISGFLIEINPSDLEIMDAYEGYPDIYNRVIIDVNGIDAWIYVSPDIVSL